MRDDAVKKRIALYKDALAKELGEGAKGSHSWTGLNIDSNDGTTGTKSHNGSKTGEQSTSESS